MSEPDISEDKSPPRPRKLNRFQKSGLAFVLIGLLIGGGFVYYRAVYGGYFPHKLSSQASMSLYYPIKPPSGMSVDQASFSAPSKNVITYIVSDSQSNKFYVAMQLLPDTFNFAKFKSKFEKTEEFTANAGSVLIGDLGNQLVASIQTPKNSWIIVNTTAFSQQAELEALCRAFVQTK